MDQVRTGPIGSIAPFFLSISVIVRHTKQVHDEVAVRSFS
jgi:hypothetical protein